MARGAQRVPRAGLSPGTAGSVISGLGWAGLTRWQQLLSHGQLSDSSGREGDRPKTGLAFLWATVSWRESQDFIFFLMPLKVMLSSGTWRGCLMWWSCWQPPLHPGNCEQGIPIALRPHHHLEMLSQHHVLHMDYPVHPYSIRCFSQTPSSWSDVKVFSCSISYPPLFPAAWGTGKSCRQSSGAQNGAVRRALRAAQLARAGGTGRVSFPD